MKYALAYAAFHARHLGMLGMLGAALCVGVLAYALIEVPKHDTQTIALRKELASVHAARRAVEATIAKQGGASDTSSSAIVIPNATETPALLFKLEDLARKNGLQIKRNDYRYVDAAAAKPPKGKIRETGPSRYVEVRINAPTAGSYNNLRKFIDDAMRDVPALALDDISLKRDAIGNGQVQAVLRFSLFVRNAT